MRIIALFAAVLLCSTLFAQMEHANGELIVQLKDNSQVEQFLQDFSAVGNADIELELIEELSAPMHLWHFKFNPNSIDENTLLRLVKMNENVGLAQFNHFVEKRETTPNDPVYGNQWHHYQANDKDIDSDLAWDITTGGLTAAGDEIVVCVIEGGNLNHPDLVDNKWVNENEIPNNGIDDDENGYVDDYEGWNVNNENDDFGANNGHGTNVFGMIGAKGNNENGVAGINWDVKLMGIAGYNIGSEANIIQCYTYPLIQRQLYEATNGDKGAFVVATNASWGIDGGDVNDVPVWTAFYDTLGTYGILNCGATTNSALNVDVQGDIPTAAPSDYMISVTATNNDDVRTFSGYGQTTIDLGAPGEAVWTSSGSSQTTSTSGTSFASPLTAGAIALLYSAPCPSLAQIMHADPQTAADLVRQALFDGVDLVPNLTTECVTGGRLNVNNSLQILLDNCSFNECLPPFSVSASSNQDGTYTVNWNGLGSMTSFGLRYRELGNVEWTTIEGIEGESYLLDGLVWCSEYELEMYANCEEGDSDWTSTITFETEGCCELPSLESLNLDGLSESTATLSWEDVLAANSYQLSITPEGGSAIVIGDLEESTYTFADLMPCTDYEIAIGISCQDGVIIAPEAYGTFRTLGCGACTDNAYCATIAEGIEEWIDEVSISDLASNTGSDQGYGDYTSASDLDWVYYKQNPEYNNITLTPGFDGDTYNEYFKVWIDFNQDGEFETSEEVVSEISNESITLENIAIPADALVGSTRMRISMRWSSFNQPAPEPCAEFEFGEIEDYCIFIEETNSVDESARSSFSIYPNPANNMVNLPINPAVNYELCDASGRVILRTNGTVGSVQLDQLSNGLYFVRSIGTEGMISSTKLIVQH
jgi:serine protease